MSPNGAYTFESPIVSTDTTLEIALRDALLRGAVNDGVRSIRDMGFGFSYPGGSLAGRPAPAAPADQAVIYDVAERANGKVVKVAGQNIAYAGGGLDFSTLTARGSYAEMPASVAADIWTPYPLVGGFSQRFSYIGYFRLPSLADWNASANLAPMLQWADTNYTSDPDLFVIGQTNTPGLLMSRQTAVGAAATLALNPAGHYNLEVQLLVARTATQLIFRLRSTAGIVLATGAVGADNTANFSAKTGKVGMPGNFWQASLGTQTGAKNYRWHRDSMENLARTGRDPIVAADADWDRVQARIAASAAANGGTSQIFV